MASINDFTNEQIQSVLDNNSMSDTAKILNIARSSIQHRVTKGLLFHNYENSFYKMIEGGIKGSTIAAKKEGWIKTSKYYKYTKKQRQVDRKEYLAHRKVQNALKANKLTKLPCEVCGELKVEAHHDDYDKSLDVRWLCRKHHVEVHKNINGGLA